MRLIDADSIKFEEDCTFTGKGLNEFIKAIPTAYDADKVVEQLEEKTELAYKRYMDCGENAHPSACARYSTQYSERKMCLDIVKAGMRNDH